MLEKLMRSDAEVKVLGVVLFEEGLHLREISRRAGVSPSEAKRELDNLTTLGVLRRERKGNLTIFVANSLCPFLGELRLLYMKTEGFLEETRNALSKIIGIRYAFIYGSTAAGNFGEKSDIDLLVIGNLDEDELTRRIGGMQRNMAREINWILWSERDFANKLKEKSSFINSVLKGKIVWLAGDYDEFERTASKAVG